MQRTLPLVTLLVIPVLLVGLACVTAQHPDSSAPQRTDPLPILPVGGSFTYQGELRNASGPMNGSCDLEFSLWDAITEGEKMSRTFTEDALSISQGRSTVQPDFGRDVFDGDARYLQIAVRCPAGSGNVSLLSPRQTLTTAPYALHAYEAARADRVPWSGIPNRPTAYLLRLLISNKIAFVSKRDGTHDIYVMNADGSNQTRLTNHPAFDLAPAWSPDGSQIAFVSSRDGGYEIYAMQADGSNPTRLTTNVNSDTEPAWSPGGGKIAFTSGRDGNAQIYVMNTDGSNQTNLTNHIADDTEPAWSPDGSQIAFVSKRDGTHDIYVMNADGSNQTNLTNHIADDTQPAWSPDGSQIAFVSTRDGDYEIYAMQADGSNPTRLTTNTAFDFEPAWSPGGSQIAFTSGRDGNAQIYVMNADGSNPTRLSNHVNLNGNLDREPAW